MFEKKPTEFDTSQDKQIQTLIQQVNALWKDREVIIIAYNKGFSDVWSFLKQKEQHDKTQDTQLVDAINRFENALKDLKAKSHEHTVTETQP